MGRREIEDRLFPDFEALVGALGMGLELLDVELASENKASVLRVTVYKRDGVTLDDCATVQQAVSDRLDEIDPIPGSYTLEVSSPGLDRTLRRDKEFTIYQGEFCQANLFAPVEGKRVYQGTLVGLVKDDSGADAVAIDTGEGRVLLARTNVSKVKLLFDERKDL